MRLCEQDISSACARVLVYGVLCNVHMYSTTHTPLPLYIYIYIYTHTHFSTSLLLVLHATTLRHALLSISTHLSQALSCHIDHLLLLPLPHTIAVSLVNIHAHVRVRGCIGKHNETSNATERKDSGSGTDGAGSHSNSDVSLIALKQRCGVYV